MIVRVYGVPNSDVAFGKAAQAYASNGSNTPAKLMTRLREQWPDSFVVAGITDGGDQRWYAYRDGRWYRE